MHRKNGFDLHGIDVEATAYDEFLGTTHDIELTVLIHSAEVARRKPAAAPQDRVGRRFVTIIAEHPGRSLDPDFTALIRTGILPILAHDPDLNPGLDLADFVRIHAGVESEPLDCTPSSRRNCPF